MRQTIDHDELDDALRNCGSSWRAAQAHGLLCGRLAIKGVEAPERWLLQVLENSGGNAEGDACRTLLETLCNDTWSQLIERQSELTLLLPDDNESARDRATAMGLWCEGFLHGLVSEKHSEDLKKRLSSEPLDDIIKDMLQITRATADDAEDSEAEESAYVELVEYLRVAAQLAYEELAEFREPAAEGEPDDSTTLH